MVAGALIAQEDADAGGGPLRVPSAAIEARLKVKDVVTYLIVGLLRQLLEDGVAFLVWHVVVHFGQREAVVFVSLLIN